MRPCLRGFAPTSRSTTGLSLLTCSVIFGRCGIWRGFGCSMAGRSVIGVRQTGGMATNPGAALDLLHALLAEHEAGEAFMKFNDWKERGRAALRIGFGESDGVVKRYDDVRYGLMISSSSTPPSDWDKAKRSGLARAASILNAAAIELTAKVAPLPNTGPVDSFHPWVSGAIVGLWESDPTVAVREASRAVEIRLKAKIGAKDPTFTELVGMAFSEKEPDSSCARLRFDEFTPGTQEWTNAHTGAMRFGQGCAFRIRNLQQHADLAVERQEALEMLASLSLLARWIDGASVVAAPQGA